MDNSTLESTFLVKCLSNEVRITGDDLVVVSFPGPDGSIRLEDLQAGRAVSRRYRNRRIGEFLKELELTEGRATGIPKFLKVMAANGSPAPVFETDEERTFFIIRLPCHPQAISKATMEVAMEVAGLLLAVQGEMSRQEIQAALGLIRQSHFRKAYVLPALVAGYLEMTLPDQPNSRMQRYRLTQRAGDGCVLMGEAEAYRSTFLRPRKWSARNLFDAELEFSRVWC